MKFSSSYHPSGAMLADFAAGTLSTGLSVAISAHVELCASCKNQVSEAEQKSAMAWDAQPEPVQKQDYSAMINAIVAQAQEKNVELPQLPVDEIHMPGHSVALPRVLSKIASDGLVWKKLAGGINQARVELDNETQCEFIYMKPGSRTPVHTHQGTEITLVLDGKFSDEMGEYGPSDFIVRDRKDHHQPFSDEGCLCFAVLDSPLTFTRGLARLLNPFIRYKFRKATSAGV